MRDDTRFEAALGAILGALVGDAAGAFLEFSRPPIGPADAEHAMTLPGGGIWGVAPGQITDDGELTMSLLRALVEAPDGPTAAAAAHYARWVASDPFDMGTTTALSLGCLDVPEYAETARVHGAHVAMRTAAAARCMASKANGSLMRATPLAVWGASRDRAATIEAAMADARLSHPNDACVVACAAYVTAIRHLVLGRGDAAGAIAAGRDVASKSEEVAGWLDDALSGVRVPYTPQDGFVRIGLSHAFRHLALDTSYTDAIRETLAGGGDTDTNACIVGGLLGARWGAAAIPEAMREAVLTCDTTRGKNPRPDFLHPRDVPVLVARLVARLVAGNLG